MAITISKDAWNHQVSLNLILWAIFSAFCLKCNWLQMGFICEFHKQFFFTHFDENHKFFHNVAFSTVLYQEISLFYLQKQLVLHYSLDDFLFEMDSTQLMLMLEMVSVMVAWESKNGFLLVLPILRSDFGFSSLAVVNTFPCKLITRICSYIKDNNFTW